VVGNSQICGLSIEPLEALKMLNILGALDDETKLHGDTLTNNSGIAISITRVTWGFPHIAGPSGITAVERRRIHDLGNPINVFIQITDTMSVEVIDALLPEDLYGARQEVHYLWGRISQILNPIGNEGSCVQDKPIIDARKAHSMHGTMMAVKCDGDRMGNVIKGGGIALELILVALNSSRM
jgi:hypothetical protein